MIFLDHTTKTSTNYELLFELMQKQRIICLVDYNSYPQNKCHGDNDPIWDVCQTPCIGEYPFYELSSRGNNYISAQTKEEFIQKCAAHKVRFISPFLTIENTTLESENA